MIEDKELVTVDDKAAGIRGKEFDKILKHLEVGKAKDFIKYLVNCW